MLEAISPHHIDEVMINHEAKFGASFTYVEQECASNNQWEYFSVWDVIQLLDVFRE